MTPADWLLDETRQWVKRAESDLRAADLCMAELPSEALEPACALSKYAWAFRYPGALYEPETGEAAAGRTLAQQVRAAIARRLPRGELPPGCWNRQLEEQLVGAGGPEEPPPGTPLYTF